jgi:hypothetical protein
VISFHYQTYERSKNMGLEETISAIEKWNAEAEAQKGKLDRRFSGEARKAEEAKIEAIRAAQVEELNQRFVQELAAARDALDEDDRRGRLMVSPSGAAQWQETAARAEFVAQDVAEMKPGDVIRAYRAAKASDDKPGMYLLERFGRARLKALNTSDTDANLRHAAQAALKELETLAYGDLVAKRQKEEARLADLERKARQLTAKDRLPEIKTRFGIG